MSSQGTTNKISLTKAKINKAFKEAVSGLQFVTTDFEVEIDNDTMLFVDIETNDYNNYEELVLLDVEVMRNDKSYDNIALFLFEKINAEINDLNLDRYKEYLDWEDQNEYETMGGRFSHLSYY